MAETGGTRSGLAAVLDRLAGLEARHRDRSFAALRSAVLAGEEGAWAAFVEKYSRFTYTVALRLLSGERDREETAAAVYSRVFDRLAAGDHRVLREFRGRCRFTSYLYRIVQSERKDHYRRLRSEPRTVREAREDEIAEDPPDAPVVRSEMLRDAVRDALDRLGPGERTLLLCRFRDGLKLREIADVFGFKDTNVADRAVRRALGRLDLLRTLQARHRLGGGEVAALERELREQLFRTGDADNEVPG